MFGTPHPNRGGPPLHYADRPPHDRPGQVPPPMPDALMTQRWLEDQQAQKDFAKRSAEKAEAERKEKEAKREVREAALRRKKSEQLLRDLTKAYTKAEEPNPFVFDEQPFPTDYPFTSFSTYPQPASRPPQTYYAYGQPATYPPFAQPLAPAPQPARRWNYTPAPPAAPAPPAPAYPLPQTYPGAPAPIYTYLSTVNPYYTFVSHDKFPPFHRYTRSHLVSKWCSISLCLCTLRLPRMLRFLHHLPTMTQHIIPRLLMLCLINGRTVRMLACTTINEIPECL